MSGGDARGLVATFIDAPARGELRVRPGALIEYDADGLIRSVHEGGADSVAAERLAQAGRLEELPPGSYVLPGLIDLHIHAPQWPQLGKALDVPLEVWLNDYTFPLEARYADLDYAHRVYDDLVTATIGNGTTTAVYYGTVHLEATQLLADLCLAKGQRAVIGKVAMDHPDNCPGYYRDTNAAEGLESTRSFVDYVSTHPANKGGLVRPAITPRFIPSCTDDLLFGLGDIAEATGCRVQTHCSESDWAHRYGIERFGQSDTRTYADFGLLRRATILAHANFISEADMAMIAAAGAAVAHCPLSNAFFANAVFPTRTAFAAGVHVGLGTDVSGGPSPSILDAAGNAVLVSRMLEDGVDPSTPAVNRGVAGSRIDFAEAFWMATTGGGIALDLPIGLFEPGYRFDAVAVDGRSPNSDLTIWPELDGAADVVQKIIHNARRSEVFAVWIDGRKAPTSA